jgi:hypothetical protein
MHVVLYKKKQKHDIKLDSWSLTKTCLTKLLNWNFDNSKLFLCLLLSWQGLLQVQ